MKSKIGNYLLAVALGFVIMFGLHKCNPETVEVPVEVKVEVPVPVVEHKFDTLYMPVPKRVVKVDTSLVGEFRKANDSLKAELFKQAVTIKEYTETFEDSIQTIDVTAKAAMLESLSVSYKTKPRLVTLDTTINVPVPVEKFAFSPYMEAGVPTKILDGTLVLKAGLDVQLNKNWVVGASYDTEGRAWLKIGKTFKLY